MSRGSWDRSAARPAARGPRPGGSFGLALARARAVWAELTGEPAGGVYSVEAAAAIVALALGLWADTAAAMGTEGPEDG